MSLFPHQLVLGSTGNAPTYYVSLAWGAGSVNEDGTTTATLTLNATAGLIPNGTTVGVTYSGTNVTAGDLTSGSLTDTITINSNTGSVTITATADLALEGAETLTAQIASVDSAGNPTGSLTADITINDTSKPYYQNGAFDVASIPEDGATVATYSVDAVGVADTVTIPYTITGVSAADISVALTGNMTVSSQVASLSFTATADQLTEGTETATLALGATDSAGNDADSPNNDDSVDITDTSIPTYAVEFTTTYNSNAGIRENNSDTATFTVTTTNIPDGTTVDYTVSGTGITVGELSLTSLTGTITINSNTGSFSFTALADGITEGNETLTCQIAATDSAGNATGTEANRRDSIIIYDTSGTPQYTSGSFNVASINENNSDTAIFTASGSGLANGTLNFTISGVSLSEITYSTDGTNYSQPGSTTVTMTVNNNSGKLWFRANADASGPPAEGTETLTLTSANSDSNGITAGLPLADSFNINDTSSTTGSYDSFTASQDWIVESINNYEDAGGDPEGYPYHSVFTLATSSVPDGTRVGFDIGGSASTSDWQWRVYTSAPTSATWANSSQNNWSSAISGIMTINSSGFSYLVVRTLPRPGSSGTELAETFTVTLQPTDDNGDSTGSLQETVTIHEYPQHNLSVTDSTPNEGSTVTYTFTVTSTLSNAQIDGWTYYKSLSFVQVGGAAGPASSADISSGYFSGSPSFQTTNKSATWNMTFANDSTTEGTESFITQVFVGNPASAIYVAVTTLDTIIQDTSQTPITDFPAATYTFKSFDGTWALDSDWGILSTYFTTFGCSLGAYHLFHFQRQSSSWRLRVANGLSHVGVYKDTSNVQQSWPAVDCAHWTGITGNVAPDEIKIEVTPRYLFGDAGVVEIDGVQGIAGGCNAGTGIFSQTPGIWYSITGTQSGGFQHYVTGQVAEGFTATATSEYQIDLWCRKTGYNDTKVATFISRIRGRDSCPTGGPGPGGPNPE